MVELMAILGIAALLSSMLVPAMGGMQERARTTKCTENLKQIGTALLTYSLDHSGALPQTGESIPYGAVGSNGQAGWTEQIDNYLPCDRQVFVCPSSSRVLSSNRNYSYFLGAHAAYLDEGKFAPVQLALVRDPARHIMAGDIAAPVFDKADADKDDSIANPAFTATRTPFHKGTVNLVFYDGHVGNFKAWDDNLMTTRYSGKGGY